RGGRIVEVDDVAEDLRERHQREGLASSPRFGFGDLQQIVEHLNELVDLLNGEPSGLGQLGRAASGAQRLFEAAADASQRGSEIVCNRVRYVPYTVHQVFDAIKHAVDVTIGT